MVWSEFKNHRIAIKIIEHNRENGEVAIFKLKMAKDFQPGILAHIFNTHWEAEVDGLL